MTATVVEHWNSFARIRQDLFGCIDVLALKEGSIIGIQATTKPNVSSRIKKASALPALRSWMRAGGIFEVWGWEPNARGRWDVTIVPLHQGDLTTTPDPVDATHPDRPPDLTPRNSG